MGLLRRFARARLASQVIRRLRRSGVTDARYDARAFTVRFTLAGDPGTPVVNRGALVQTIIQLPAGDGPAASVSVPQ